ncbi:MAG: hypothetical protein ACXVHB_06035 [Solirubrobacteraceae bacterium]
MTTKDYTNAAAVFARELAEQPAHRVTVSRIARAVADMFKQDNSRFDYQRFYDACGLGVNGR